jgi:hypothetical protein
MHVEAADFAGLNERCWSGHWSPDYVIGTWSLVLGHRPNTNDQ